MRRPEQLGAALAGALGVPGPAGNAEIDQVGDYISNHYPGGGAEKKGNCGN